MDRVQRVEAIRRKIKRGEYETAGKLEAAAEAFLRELRGADPPGDAVEWREAEAKHEHVLAPRRGRARPPRHA